MSKETFWLFDPLVLITNYCNFNILSNVDFETNLNAYTRFIMLAMTICYCLTQDIKYIYIGVVLIIIIIVVYLTKNSNQQNFTGDSLKNFVPFNYLDKNNDNIKYMNKVIAGKLDYEKLPYNNEETPNSVNNPLGNPEITDYGKPQKYLETKFNDTDNINEKIKNGLAQQQSQYVFDTGVRQYYTMPNSSIPNDTMAYANWLYGKDKVCKEGSIYMHRTGQPEEQKECTGFNTSVPTNFGNLND